MYENKKTPLLRGLFSMLKFKTKRCFLLYLQQQELQLQELL